MRKIESAILFSGSSGTGKTLAAEFFAGELGVELLKVDLAKMVSKYVSETEKMLERLFDTADEGSAVLLFDEADFLFGKRTAISDSHDRYANIEVTYLLETIERYPGLVILATNNSASIDEAFLRRLRFIIEFPLPSARERERIWDDIHEAINDRRSKP